MVGVPILAQTSNEIDEIFLILFALQNRFPFDSNNPSGYLIATILEYIVIGYEFFVIACTLAFAVGIIWFVISTIEEFKSCLHRINRTAQVNDIEPNKLKILFTQFIYAHGTINQLSNNMVGQTPRDIWRTLCIHRIPCWAHSLMDFLAFQSGI